MLEILTLLLAGARPAAPPPPPPPPTPTAATPATTPAAIDYATVVQDALTAALPGFAKAEREALAAVGKSAWAAGLELEIAVDGSLRGEGPAVSSGSNAFDDLARALLLAAEPFSPPEPGGALPTRPTRCIARVALAPAKKGPALDTAVACFPPDKPLPTIAGGTAELGRAKDAAAALLTGYGREAAGDLGAAMQGYRKAVQAAPAWDLAARAMGLVLVKDKKIPQAIPYLKTYVEARAASPDAVDYAREIERYEKSLAARLAEETRVRDRLTKEDIARGIRKSYPLLEPCLRSARKARALAVGLDTLVVSFTINKDGAAIAARLEAPTGLLMTEHAECVERAVSGWRFPRYSAGSEVTVARVPLKVRGAPPLPPPGAAPTAAPAASEPVDEPAFSTCDREPDEIQEFVRSRYGRLQACFVAERSRAPKVAFPDNLMITFVIDASGPVRGAGVDHRAYREGPLTQCVAAALAGDLPPVKGADCPAEFSVDLRSMMPARR
ncbi:MAG: hypothetical protein HY903_02225 [Deltaproteobacteria bacterium]|nr:hypothetical protein [Deltaproteobacteria bacterium]